MMTITKHFTFDAAHHIPTMPEGHKCRGMHGHTYGVTLKFEWPDDNFDWARGFMVDYGRLAEMWKKIAVDLDHKVLNDVVGLEIPTTEVLARWIWNRWQTMYPERNRTLAAVEVAESSTTVATYSP